MNHIQSERFFRTSIIAELTLLSVILAPEKDGRPINDRQGQTQNRSESLERNQ